MHKSNNYQKLFQYLALTRYKSLKLFINKLSNRNVSVILDLEDSAQNIFDKNQTEILKKQSIEGLNYLSDQSSNSFQDSEIFIRINSIKTKYFIEDFKTIVFVNKKGLKINGLFIPKVENYEEIVKIHKMFMKEEINFHYIPIIETQKGLKNLDRILTQDINNNLIQAVHYGHFDYCLDANIWPFPDPFHYEFWDLIDIIVKKIQPYGKRYIHTPFPFLKNKYFFWAASEYIKELYPKLLFSLSSINVEISLSKKSEIIKKLSLKHVSREPKFLLHFANKICKNFENNTTKNRSFAVSDKRFIPPHQYLMAKKYVNNQL